MSESGHTSSPSLRKAISNAAINQPFDRADSNYVQNVLNDVNPTHRQLKGKMILFINDWVTLNLTCGDGGVPHSLPQSAPTDPPAR